MLRLPLKIGPGMKAWGNLKNKIVKPFFLTRVIIVTMAISTAIIALTSQVRAREPAEAISTISSDNGQNRSSLDEIPPQSLTVKLSVTVLPSRLIVVDENDGIIEIWSNTREVAYGSYSLKVREQEMQGPEHALTEGILTQYNVLLAKVDWRETGLVYRLPAFSNVLRP